MKKVISLLILVVMILGVTTISQATTSSELANKIYEIGKPYGMTEDNRVRIERYLKENPVSDDVANQVVANAEKVAQIFKNRGVTDYSKLTNSDKDSIKSIANETASLLGLTLKFEAKRLYIYKNGELIETFRYDNSKLLYTGNSNGILIGSSIVAIALIAGITTIATRKKLANA